MTPVMYVDPEGESIVLILMIGFTASVLGFTLYATAPLENNAEENITLSGGATPEPSGVGAQLLGIGFEGSVNQVGTTIDIEGNTHYTVTHSGRVLLWGISNTTSTDGSNTLTLSYSIMFISLNTNDILNKDSYGAGLSFGGSASSPYGGVNFSYDIDFLGLIHEQFTD